MLLTDEELIKALNDYAKSVDGYEGVLLEEMPLEEAKIILDLGRAIEKASLNKNGG